MKTIRCFGTLALLAHVAGCMVGPDYQRPNPSAPSAWGELRLGAAGELPSQPGPQDVVDAWWTQFDDPLLSSLVERAVRASPDADQAEARVRAARAARDVVRGALAPSVGASADYTRARSSDHGPGTSATQGRWSDLFQTGFDASWELDVFGGIRRSVEAADATAEAAAEDRNAVLLSLMAEVARNYVEYRSVEHRLDLVHRNLDAQQKTFELTKRLMAAGLAPELDVARAESQVATTASSIPQFEALSAQAMHALSVLAGEEPMALHDELEPAAPIPSPPALVGLGLPSELLLRRPDVRRSERELAAATAEIGVSTSDLLPRFVITGATGLESVSARSFFDASSAVASVGPSIVWPVFQGGRIRANVALKTAQQEEAFAAYRAAVLQAFQEVEDALAAFSREQSRLTELRDAEHADQRAADFAQRLYGQGLTDFLAVLDAERSLFASQDALAQSQRDVDLDLVALYKAVGGGWQTATLSMSQDVGPQAER